MTINSYATLKTAVDTWADLGGSLDSQMDDLLIMANDSLNNGMEFGLARIPALRVREMEAVSSLTPSSNVCTLPSDYLQYRRIVEKASPRRSLTYIAPDVADTKYPDRAAGLANEFTIIGGSLYMYPLSTKDIELTYYQKIPDITSSVTSNWLLTKRPSIYLHACLVQVAIIRRDDELLQRSAQLVSAIAAAMKSGDEMANYAYAPAQIRGITVA